MKNLINNQEYNELLRLSVEAFRSLRRKYPFRERRTPEFEVWQRFLEEQVGRGHWKSPNGNF